MTGERTPIYTREQKKKLKTPHLKRLAIEHDALDDLCWRSNKLSYKVMDSRNSIPCTYHISYAVKSIVGIDEDENPIYDNLHVAELALPPNYPVEPAKCYMVTDTWHPNIKSEGVHKGHICTNSTELGKLMDLYMLVHRIGKILQYQNYHAENVYPYPDDEKVARWIRDYAEPNDIVNKNKHIFVDDRELLVLDDGPAPDKPILKVVTTVVEDNTPAEEDSTEEPKTSSFSKIVIRGLKPRPKPKGKITIKKKD